MLAHTRAMIAAAAHAFVTHQKVAGVYDHSSGLHLRIAAEAKGEHLQGYDGDRSTKFGGTLPEIYEAGSKTYVSFEIDGTIVKGFDRASSAAWQANVNDQMVQLYDYGSEAWFAFNIQTA